MTTERTFNTLFLLSSVDGKISTGDTDARDVDRDFPRIAGVREGLFQYYDLEGAIDHHSLNTGRVMAKIGMNEERTDIARLPFSFIIVDNKPHLNEVGVRNLLRKCQALYLVTTHTEHPALSNASTDLVTIRYDGRVDWPHLFAMLKKEHGIERVTLQSGGTLNATLAREGLIDRISIVVAPAIIGGSNTSTVVDGRSLRSDEDLKYIKALKLERVDRLKHSFVCLQYSVLNCSSRERLPTA